MNEASSDVLKIIIGVVLTILVALMAFGFYNKAQDMSKTANDQLAQMDDMLKNGNLDAYDGAIVKGSDVLSCIQSNKSATLCVQVVNGSTTTEYGRKSTDLAQKADGKLAAAKDKANVSTVYIDPTNDYEGELMYYNNDSAQTIIGVKFTLQTK